MKQEQFRNVYRHIRLTAQQKDRIWKQIESASGSMPTGKRSSFAARAAVCFGALLMSGMTVYAVSGLSLMDKLADAMRILTQNENDPTQEQQNLYEQYGKTLDNEIELENGTLRLDAALYDENHLLIAFRYLFDPDTGEFEALTAGTEFEQKNLPESWNSYHRDADSFLHDFRFYTLQDSTHLTQTPYGAFLLSSPKIAEDGILSGSILLYCNEAQTFKQGDVILLARTAGTDTPGQTAGGDDADINSEPLASITLEKALEPLELTVSTENAAALEDMGISVERMTLSPLSLCYSGTGTHPRILSSSITVVLKDGRIIESSPNGSGYALSDTGRNKTSFSFIARELFAEPVLPEEVAEIHISNSQGADIHIPVGNSTTK